MAKSRRLTSGAGWSLEPGCPECGRAARDCRCPQEGPAAAPGRQEAKLRLEKRCGKPLTVVAGLVLAPEGMKALLKELKNLCGAGGTFKNGELEIQGDQRELLRAHLAGKGIRVKG